MHRPASPASTRRAVAIACVLLALAAPSHARTAADPACAPQELAAVAVWLAAHPFLAGPTKPEEVVASACKPSPKDKGMTIVAAAYDNPTTVENGNGDGKSLVVALVDSKGGKIRSAFKGTVHEDAVMRLEAGGLSLDTARYDLAPGVRAFGVDIASSASGPRCAEGGLGPWRTLFVQDGPLLRDVLDGVVLSTWRYAAPPCSGGADDGEVVERTTTFISIAAHATNGYADLVITQSSDLPAGDKHARNERHVLHYDGSSYRDDHVLDPVIDEEAAPATTR